MKGAEQKGSLEGETGRAFQRAAAPESWATPTSLPCAGGRGPSGCSGGAESSFEREDDDTEAASCVSHMCTVLCLQAFSGVPDGEGQAHPSPALVPAEALVRLCLAPYFYILHKGALDL